MGWVKYATVGAKAGTDLRDASGASLGDNDVKNSVAISTAADDATNKADAAELAAKVYEQGYRVTFPANSEEGVFSYQIGTTGSAVTEHVFSEDERNKLYKLRQGQDPLYSDRSILNNDIDVTFSSNSLSLSGIGGSNTASITKGTLGLSYTDGATVGAVIGTNMYDTNGSTALDADDLKNGNITLHADGYLVNAGTGTVKLSNEKIASGDLAGSGKAFSTLPASGATVGATVGTNFYKSGTTTNYNTNEFQNADISISQGSAGVLTLNRGVSSDTTTITKALLALSYDDGATVGAIAGTNLKAANGTTTLGDDDVKNSALDVDISGTAIKLKIGSTETSTVTASQGLVGLSGVANNATVGAIAGTNLKAANGTTTLGDDDVKNSALDVAISGTAIKLKIGSTETSTVTASQGLVGLSGVSNNADQTSSNTANNTSNVGDKTVAEAQSRLGYLSDTGELSGSLAAAQFPMRAAITAANAGDARTALGAGTSNFSGSAANLTGYISKDRFATTAGNFPMLGAITASNAANARTAMGAGTSNFSGSAVDLTGNLDPDRLNASDFPMKSMIIGANAAAVKTTLSLNNVDNNSTATIRGGVTTASVTSGTGLHSWTQNTATEYAPSGTTQVTTIEWRDGSGGLLKTGTITSTLNTDDNNIDVTRAQTGTGAGSVAFSGDTADIGAAGSTTVATYNLIKVSVFHSMVDLSGWTFK